MAEAYKRPESVLVVVYTADTEVLMLRRVSPADFWQSVTGSLLWGESPDQAARRELAEETGLQAGDVLLDCQRQNTFPIVPPWIARYAPGVVTNTEYVFSVALPRRQPIRLNPLEHGGFQWLQRDAAAGLASSYTNRQAILDCVPSI